MRVGENKMSVLSSIVNVEFDNYEAPESYRAKYVLVEISTPEGDSKIVARAKRGAAYHRDVYEPFQQQARTKNIHASMMGGGRIEVNSALKTLLVYGYSVDFGKADHKVTVSLAQEQFPEWDISYSDDGY